MTLGEGRNVRSGKFMGLSGALAGVNLWGRIME